MKHMIKGYDRASILDCAIIAGGNIDCVLDFCELNGLALTDYIEIGKSYYTPILGAQYQNNIVERISLEGIRPATELSRKEIEMCPFGGIGYMGIEIDFEVS